MQASRQEELSRKTENVISNNNNFLILPFRTWQVQICIILFLHLSFQMTTREKKMNLKNIPILASKCSKENPLSLHQAFNRLINCHLSIWFKSFRGKCMEEDKEKKETNTHIYNCYWLMSLFHSFYCFL